MLESDVGQLPADLADRRAVVTGAASGIGLAIAYRLALAGARVIAIDADKGRLAGMSDDARFAGLHCTPVYGDLTRPDISPLADQLLAGGPIELIVNNVGTCSATAWFEAIEDVRLVFQTNLFAPWFLTKRLVERLIEQGRPGSILFVSSLHDQVAVQRPLDRTSKAAVAMLVRELAHELPRYGIRVNTISPGRIRADTPMAEVEMPSGEGRSAVPMGHASTPDEVARVAVFLLSDACSGSVNGTDVAVSGGLAAPTWRQGPQALMP